jgi:hypothetical protein
MEVLVIELGSALKENARVCWIRKRKVAEIWCRDLYLFLIAVRKRPDDTRASF